MSLSIDKLLFKSEKFQKQTICFHSRVSLFNMRNLFKNVLLLTKQTISSLSVLLKLAMFYSRVLGYAEDLNL